MRKYVFILAFMLIAQVASAETYQIGKYLQVSPPKGIDVTFQIFEAYDPKEKIDFAKIPVPVILGLRLKNQINKYVWPDGVPINAVTEC